MPGAGAPLLPARPACTASRHAWPQALGGHATSCPPATTDHMGRGAGPAGLVCTAAYNVGSINGLACSLALLALVSTIDASCGLVCIDDVSRARGRRCHAACHAGQVQEAAVVFVVLSGAPACCWPWLESLLALVMGEATGPAPLSLLEAVSQGAGLPPLAGLGSACCRGPGEIYPKDTRSQSSPDNRRWRRRAGGVGWLAPTAAAALRGGNGRLTGTASSSPWPTFAVSP